MDLAQFDAAIATLTTGLAELEAAGPDGAVDNEYLRLTDVMRRDIALARLGSAVWTEVSSRRRCPGWRRRGRMPTDSSSVLTSEGRRPPPSVACQPLVGRSDQ